MKPAWMSPDFRYPPSSPAAIAAREAIKWVPREDLIAELERALRQCREENR